MHELALMEGVIATLQQRIVDARVTTVRLEVGRWSAVVPDALRFCFDVCAAGTLLEGAALEIVIVEATAHCRGCARVVELEDVIPLCRCGSADLEMLTGTELRIREVEVI